MISARGLPPGARSVCLSVGVYRSMCLPSMCVLYPVRRVHEDRLSSSALLVDRMYVLSAWSVELDMVNFFPMLRITAYAERHVLETLLQFRDCAQIF